MDPLLQVNVAETGEVQSAAVIAANEDADKAEVAPLAGLLKIDHPTGKEQGQLAFIMAYLRENASDATNISALLWQLRDIENRLSAPRIGESRLSKIYNYVRLAREVKEREAERDSLLQ